MTAIGEKAARNLTVEHMNCAQSVLTAFCEDLGLDRATALRLVMGFGGGEGHTGGTCGAVIGAYLTFGLQQDLQADMQPAKDKAVAKILEFSRRFKEIHGSTLCPDLLGYDVRIEEQFKAAVKDGVFLTKCPVFIQDAAELVEKMGKEHIADSTKPKA
jgi:C_GCAxxG_C_C family probable redox protein